MNKEEYKLIVQLDIDRECIRVQKKLKYIKERIEQNESELIQLIQLGGMNNSERKQLIGQLDIDRAVVRGQKSMSDEKLTYIEERIKQNETVLIRLRK